METVGTMLYMPPEIYENHKGKPIDIFSFGVTIFTLVSGIPPYSKGAKLSDPFYKHFI